MTAFLRPLALAAWLALAAAGAAADEGIAWRPAANDADIDAAFDLARRENRPVFVYWGARWCPPCNQVKATLFNRRDFIERSRAFVPVYVDGDAPGAQKLGVRFKVSGYPTMLLFTPRGTETTRLPGEVDPARYTEVLTLGLAAGRPVRQLLAEALAGGATLAADDWRLLAFYSWDTDQQQLVPKGGTPAVLRTLAAACPAALGDVARRLQLQSLAAAEGAGPPPTPAAREALRQVLADPAAARSQTDLLVGAAPEIVRAASARGTPERVALLRSVDAALARLARDATLSRADRLAALDARVQLVRIDVPKGDDRRARVPRPPAPLLAELRNAAARADREITDGYERQAVVTAAADALSQAGLGDESTALLKANLAKSHSPYYLMSMLSKQARERGDRAAAVDWSAKAFSASEGPATRLQWGASHLATLVELAPQDAAGIERTATQVVDEAAGASDAFEGRSARSLQRAAASLQRWNADGRHGDALGRLRQRLDAVCERLPAGGPDRASCETLLAPPRRPA